MDHARYSAIGHAGMSICNPIGSAAADAALAMLDPVPGQRALDAGCGKAELLLRLAERYGVRGVGVDLNDAFLAEARAAAARRVPDGTVEFHTMDVRAFDAPAASFELALCTGSTHVYGGYRPTLRSLAALLKPGGRILVGEGYWRREPDPEYLALLGGTRDEFLDHAGNLAAAEAEGLAVVHAVETSLADWDAYEDGYARSIEGWVAAHPDDPAAAAMRERITGWHEGYRRWGRETLGFALYVLRVPTA